MNIYEKLHILADSAKYDVSCASSGGAENYKEGAIGCNHKNGICHTYTSDGRCVSLLKVLFTNFCVYDCSYCINRASNEKLQKKMLPLFYREFMTEFHELLL